MDPLHAQLLLTPPLSALILTQTCHVHVLVFVITAPPLVTNPMDGEEPTAQGNDDECPALEFDRMGSVGVSRSKGREERRAGGTTLSFGRVMTSYSIRTQQCGESQGELGRVEFCTVDGSEECP